MKPPSWLRQPIAVDWMRSMVVTVAGARPRYQLRAGDREKAQQEQRARAALLVEAMGLRTGLSDNQVAKMVEVLGPFIPGLTIMPPAEDLVVPNAYSLAWVSPATGRPSEWPPERLLALVADVDAVRAAGRAETDRGAIRLLVNEAKARGEPSPSAKTLANRLVEARALSV